MTKAYPLMEDWLFHRLPGRLLEEITADDAFDPSLAEEVSLPHSWFREEDPGRGLAVYRKTLSLPKGGKVFYLSFDGADQCCRVFADGIFLGSHAGGYSRFRFRLPEAAAAAGSLRVSVYLDNRLNEKVSPHFGDFTVFGGLYRKVELLCCDSLHFRRDDFGTDGVRVSAGLREDGAGLVRAACRLPEGAAGRVRYTLLDPEGNETVSLWSAGEAPAELILPSPRLWQGEKGAPLYTLRARLYPEDMDAFPETGREVSPSGAGIPGAPAEAKGTGAPSGAGIPESSPETGTPDAPSDEVCLRIGFRSLAMTPDRGLLLNGEPVRLRGVARHQDRAGVLAAASEDQIREDFDLIRDIGANAVRLSHYQHPAFTYDLCDERGLLAWAEIPMLKMTEDPDLLENARDQLTELILQNMHHPSIFCWGLQNEIAMFQDAPFMSAECEKLRETAHALDPLRPTACANLYPMRASSRLNGVTEMVGYNLYFGWYYGRPEDYGPWLDRFHARRGEVPLGISEYGVDGNPALHSESPHLKDYSEEYQALWHETVYPQIASRPWLWGSFVWNMFDFHSSRRNEGGVRARNLKGLVSWDRAVKKDAFYYYKSRWSADPFVHLCGRRFARRDRDTIAVKVYTNLPSVSLYLEDRLFGTAEAENGTAVFENVPLRMGENRLTALSGKCRDDCVLERVVSPDPSYALPEAEGAVTNWFLQGDAYTRQGYLSIQTRTDQLLDTPAAREVLREKIPALFQTLTETKVIPLGLSLKGILEHENTPKEMLEDINAALNQIPDED